MNYFIVGAFLTIIFHYLYFYFSEYIWSLNPRLSIEKYTLFARDFLYDHDGIEAFLFYAFSLLAVFVGFLIVIKISKLHSKITTNFTRFIFSLFSILLIAKVGFFVPGLNVEYTNIKVLLLFLVIVLALSLLLIAVRGTLFYWPLFIVFILLICFKATSPISNADAAFVFMPALRIWYGDSFRDMYLVYDLLIPLLIAFWMKLNIDLNLIQVFFQLTFFLFFVGLFYFLNKFFVNKKLAVFGIITIIILRYYAIGDEPTAIFQGTPLRLDLWLILLLLVYIKGVYHWSVGLCLGLFLIFHKNMGLIYTFSYFELIFALFLVELTVLSSKNELNLKTVWLCFLEKLKKLRIILVFIAICIVIVILIFGSFTPESAIVFQKIGIGMKPIKQDSMFWYIPTILLITFGLIVKVKSKIDEKYYHTALLIIFLAIGNLMYFYGRSHDINFIVISPLLILPIFICLDLIYIKHIFNLNTQIKVSTKRLIKITPILILSLVFIMSSKSIIGLVFLQINNYKINRITYSMLNIPEQKVFSDIKILTNNSKKVNFVYCGVKSPSEEFLFYYYGKYRPTGYYNPTGFYLFNKNLVSFLNELLEKDYYLVTRDIEYMEELIPLLNYTKIDTLGGYTAFSKLKNNKLNRKHN